MTDIQIKHFNGTNWESLFPKTKARVTELNDGKTVQVTITELLSSLASKVTMAEVDAEIETRINNLAGVGDISTGDTTNWGKCMVRDFIIEE